MCEQRIIDTGSWRVVVARDYVWADQTHERLENVVSRARAYLARAVDLIGQPQDQAFKAGMEAYFRHRR
jgi:uncharacterized lipoprotein YmbA